IIVCHHKVSTYFGGHLMHQSTQKQKVQGNSRLQTRSQLAADLCSCNKASLYGRSSSDGLACVGFVYDS
ncbi:hypothetical protein, partial [Bradyrhizobium sp. CW10]|uniref:hypothetical protein n=1 Tax=Bradyrhizobium sp. CW10 TaxID=2782683 RepID=UPI001FF71E5D